MDRVRHLRRRWIKGVVFVSVALSVGSLIYLARSLMLPVFVATALSYLTKPLVYSLRRRGVPGGIAIASVALLLITAVGFGVRLGVSALPQGVGLIEAQIRAEYKLNQVVSEFLRIDQASVQSGQRPLWLYDSLQDEISYLMGKANSALRISDKQTQMASEYWAEGVGERAWFYQEMLRENQQRPHWQPEIKVKGGATEQEVKAHLSSVMSQITLWLFLPIIFIFLLADDGSIIRYFLGFLPNQYFELTLTLFERVDRALGHYLRGTALECSLVGMVIGVGLFIFGADARSSVLIGAIAGVANAIPFLGPFVGLIAGLAYALVAENVNPLFSFLAPESMIFGVLISVGLAQLLDNAVFQPILVGKAVNLHPLVVVIAAAAGGMAFGFFGVLLAIPVIVVVKTFLETLISGLKDYRLI